MSYILIAYKPNSEEMTWGSIVSRYSSDFRFEKYRNAEDMIKSLVLIEQTELSWDEEGYKYYIIENGGILTKEFSFKDANLDLTENSLMKHIVDAVIAGLEDAKKEKERLKHQKEQERIELLRKHTESNERKALADLLKKYPDAVKSS